MAITAIRAQNGSLRGFWNLTDDAPHRLVHSSGPKWWTDEGSAHLRKFGDKYACFQHFSKPAASSVLRNALAALANKMEPQAAAEIAKGLAAEIAKGLAAALENPQETNSYRLSKVLVGICSSRTTALRRAAVRDTWMKRLRAGVQAVFFVGRGAGDGETDVFEMTTADDYPGLSSKIHAFCRHALEHHEFDYLFKCDDDTYVVPGRLLELAADNKPFVGSSASAPRGYADGGAGYLISREAVSAIAAAVPPPRQGAEDVWVSNLLRERGFPLTPTPLLQPGHDRLPRLANDIVTAHHCGPELMRLIDRLMTEHARIVAVLNAVLARPR
jgi:hypothetical protein